MILEIFNDYVKYFDCLNIFVFNFFLIQDLKSPL